MAYSTAELAEAAYLKTPRAIRERAEALYALGLEGKLLHFAIDESKLPEVADRVVRVTRSAHPDVRAIPYHARFRHFGAGGVDRVADLRSRLARFAPAEQLRAAFELVITSVLLDAGAGPTWGYRDAQGAVHRRSEGLAVASYDLFVGGGFSEDPAGDRFRADASVLRRFTSAHLARAFQVTPENPLVGLEGRAEVLRRLGEAVERGPSFFRGGAARLGNLASYLAGHADGNTLPASAVLAAVLASLGEIWPGREVCAGQNLGDVWRHPLVGRVPFHKLSQWLTYSLCEPLEQAGLRIVDFHELTGLAEYRNGGLFLDGGVLVPKQHAVLGEAHAVSSPVVVEWRALTIALLDRTAEAVRARLGLDAAALPLAKVLEGGTWLAGRQLAYERRPDGAPPISVESDGTVF